MEHIAVIKDEKNNIKGKLSFSGEESLLLLCEKNDIRPSLNCGGAGRCGKCRVRFEKGAPAPNDADRRFLSPDELRKGIRILCKCRIKDDVSCVISEKRDLKVIDKSTAGISWDDAGQDGYFITVDIGTTTIAMEGRSVRNGEVLASYNGENPQRAFGADVISRMEAAKRGHDKKLKELVTSFLQKGIEILRIQCESKGCFREPDFIVISANSAMTHLFMCYPVDGLIRAPFKPYTFEEVKTDIDGIDTFVIPPFSAFVGGDIRSDVEAVLFDKRDRKKLPPFMIIDMGTNAETALFDGEKFYLTAAAAGSAFDGEVSDRYASEAVGLLAALYKEGRIDVHGAFIEGKNDDNDVSIIGIRNLLLAKAAIKSGTDVLIKKSGIDKAEIENIYLAGGFGFYLDKEDAKIIGLISEELTGRICPGGNLSLAGAAAYGYKIIKGYDRSFPFDSVAVNLADEDDFNDIFIDNIDLPGEDGIR